MLQRWTKGHNPRGGLEVDREMKLTCKLLQLVKVWSEALILWREGWILILQ